jgi:hypothetical protein
MNEETAWLPGTSQTECLSNSSLAEHSMLKPVRADFKQHNDVSRINSSSHFTVKLTSVPWGTLIEIVLGALLIRCHVRKAHALDFYGLCQHREML